MTKEERLQAIQMRSAGMTYQSIADKFNVSRQYINEIIKNECFHNERRFEKASESCIYPTISNWMFDRNYSFQKFSKESGINYSKLRDFLVGKTNGNKFIIDKILKFTGLKYEEAFLTE